MKFTVLTLFPEIVDAFFATSIMSKAVERGVVSYRSVNIRDYALDKHHKCDDAPYGGGAGMLMLPEPLGRAIEAVGGVPKGTAGPRKRVVYLTPSGKPFTQRRAVELATEEELILLCGRYEGMDQRIIDTFVDDELSVGDYVLSSGEVAALVLIDATYRLIEGVITAESLIEESFSNCLLEYPQYTRPEMYDTLRVPEVLLSGHHENIRRWRLGMRVRRTLDNRPDLIRIGLETGIFDAETRKLILELQGTQNAPDPRTATDSEGDTNERD